MTSDLLSLLRCPVTKSPLKIEILSTANKRYGDREVEIIQNAILYAEEGWFYPVVDGIPRLLVESFIDYGDFLKKHLADYSQRSGLLNDKYRDLLQYAIKKNKKTKTSFEQEWRLFDYEKDRTWEADQTQMMERFLKETGETRESLFSKRIFDAGCGNGLLDKLIAAEGAMVIAMDISRSIEEAFVKNNEPGAMFIQGDIQFPPLCPGYFDIVHCSGVLIHTNNTEKSFFCIEEYVRENGKLSVWLYHPRGDRMHNMILRFRKFTSKLPVKTQHYLYRLIFLPPLYVIKKLKGKKPKTRELMVALMDQFSPEFRWEHEPEEVKSWFEQKNYDPVEITTRDLFGYNITGIKTAKG